MPPTTPSLRRGHIVWATILDPQGRGPTRRPAVVVSSDEDIAAGRPVTIVGISTRFDLAVPEENVVRLPWHPARHPRTRLREECAAFCHWLTTLPEEYQWDGGTVPAKQMLQILSRLKQLAEAGEESEGKEPEAGGQKGEG